MISLHRSMHSSQMYTPGPAMSFLTCFWLLPQNEHLSRSPPSPMRAMIASSTFLDRPACAGPVGSHGGRTSARAPSAAALPRRNSDGTRSHRPEPGFAAPAPRRRDEDRPTPVSRAASGRLRSGGRRSVPSVVRLLRGGLAVLQHVVDLAVLLGLLCREDLVPVGVEPDLLGGLAGVPGQGRLHRPADALD